MTETELRAMIRDSIARHHGGAAAAGAAAPDPVSAFNAHVSHMRLPLVRSADDDGACIIEPSVRCNHCGYCQSLGH
jgi:hypothetical protein